MNESRPSVARADRAARRNYLILCVVATLLMTASIVAVVVFSN